MGRKRKEVEVVNGIKMPNIRKNLTGMKFNRLLVLGFDKDRYIKEKLEGKKTVGIHWLCQCDCGKIKSISGYQLQSGETKSCGCYSADLTTKRNIEGKGKRKNGVIVAEKTNPTKIEGDIVYVYLDDMSDYTIIDLKNIHILNNRYFKKDKKGYWIAWRRRDDDKTLPMSIKLHQMVMFEKLGEWYDKDKFIPDHMDRNKSNNTESNLRLLTVAENARNRSLSKVNTSGKTGVRYEKSKGKYMAEIMINYVSHYLGDFDTYEEAVRARKEAELKFGFTCDDVFPEQDK